MTYDTEEERENAKKESRRIYYEKNREKIKAKMRAFNKKYFKTDKGRVARNKSANAYYKKNKEKLCAKQRLRDRAPVNKEYSKKKNAEYREKKKKEEYVKLMENQTPITLYFN